MRKVPCRLEESGFPRTPSAKTFGSGKGMDAEGKLKLIGSQEGQATDDHGPQQSSVPAAFFPCSPAEAAEKWEQVRSGQGPGSGGLSEQKARQILEGSDQMAIIIKPALIGLLKKIKKSLCELKRAFRKLLSINGPRIIPNIMGGCGQLYRFMKYPTIPKIKTVHTSKLLNRRA